MLFVLCNASRLQSRCDLLCPEDHVLGAKWVLLPPSSAFSLSRVSKTIVLFDFCHMLWRYFGKSRQKLYMVNRNPKIRRKSLFLLQVFRGVICVDESRAVSTWQYLAWIIWIFSCISGTEKYWNWSRLCSQHHLSRPFTAPPHTMTTALVGQIKC